jgi:hypothetical protein
MKLRLFLVFLLGIALMSSTAIAETTDGKVSITISSVGLILGHTRGEGTLGFRDKTYSFTVEGVGLGSVGISSVSFTGDVHNLKDVSDFAGVYFGGEVGMATGGGDAGIKLTNKKDVVLVLVGSVKGVSMKIGSEGLKVRMK